jgi:hypothetical protein
MVIKKFKNSKSYGIYHISDSSKYHCNIENLLFLLFINHKIEYS